MRYGVSNVGPAPPAVVRGHGTVVWDVDGREYLDLFAGAGRCLLGHADPGFAAALATQSGRLAVSRHPSPERADLVETLASIAPPGLTQLTMFSTGSEAVDAAVRMARCYTGQDGVIVFSGGFHGRVSGVAAYTDARWLAQPATPDARVVRCPFPTEPDAGPDAGRSPVGSTGEMLAAAATRAGGAVAAVLIEPVQGTAGNRPAPPGYLAEVSRWCRGNRALLIADEVLTGFGRTGAIFAAPPDGAEVDILAFGKGMANGFPVGAVLTRHDVAAAEPAGAPGALSSTYGGNPLAVAATAYTLGQVESLGLAQRAGTLGARWRQTLAAALADVPCVAGVDGRGLMLGVRLDRRLAGSDTDIESHLRRHHLIVGVNQGVIRLNPPLTVAAAELDRATAAITEALVEIPSHARPVVVVDQ
jgi:4-aminobutyrate aminotransferase-like enzyme